MRIGFLIYCFMAHLVLEKHQLFLHVQGNCTLHNSSILWYSCSHMQASSHIQHLYRILLGTGAKCLR